MERFCDAPIVVVGSERLIHKYERGYTEDRGVGWTACERKSTYLFLATVRDWNNYPKCKKCQPLRTQMCTFCDRCLLFTDEEWSMLTEGNRYKRPRQCTTCCSICYLKKQYIIELPMVGYAEL